MQEHEVDQWLYTLRSNAMQPFLPDLPTSRPSDLNQEFRLPGIGHPFWATARDHVFAGASPPKIPEEFTSPIETILPEQCASFVADFKANCEPTGINPIYTINWTTSTVQLDPELGLIMQLEVTPQRPNRYQDGSPMDTDSSSSLLSFHGTREVVLKSILTNGLRSSSRSHKVVGLWLNDHRESAVQWNTSLLDASPFMCCKVRANKLYDRQNSDIMQGQDNRRISELKPGMVLPSVIITQIIIGIPHPARSQWRQHLFDAFVATFQYIQALNLPHREDQNMNKLKWASTLFQLSAARVAYRETDGAMDTDFGGPFDEVPTAAIHISISRPLCTPPANETEPENYSCFLCFTSQGLSAKCSLFISQNSECGRNAILLRNVQTSGPSAFTQKFHDGSHNNQ